MGLAFILLIIDGLHVRKQKAIDTLIDSIVLWNLFSLLIIEVLSIYHKIQFRYLIVLWGIVNISILIRLLVHRNRLVDVRYDIKRINDAVKKNWFFLLIGSVVLALSIVTVPYNWDSMTYHLPRIMHWIQNGSVAHYATNDIRQISSPVLAEFINMQTCILTGKDDHLLNLLQAGSYLVNSHLVYKIAEKIECKRKFAIISTILFMSMPIAYAEALSTQVDLFATIWLLIFVYSYIDVYQGDKLNTDKKTIKNCLIMAASIGLGYLSKPSVVIGMVILLILLLVRCIKRKDGIKNIFHILAIVVPVIVILLLPESLRMIGTFHALSEPTAGERQLVGSLRPNYLFINMLKNFAHNWPNIYLYDSEEWMAKIVSVVARLCKVDIDAVSIAEDGMSYMMNSQPSYSQDSATNPIVMILAFCSFIIALVSKKKDKYAYKYTVTTMLMFILFCMLVRWECYVTRYMIAYLALLCPAIGYQLQNVVESCKKKDIGIAIISIIMFGSITQLFSMTWYHQERWHEGAARRPIGYFANNQGIRSEYEETLQYLESLGVRKIGIKLNGINYEYPIWKMMSADEVEIRHIGVENASADYTDNAFEPECIILGAGIADGTINIQGHKYEEIEKFSDNQYIKVFIINQ